MNWATIATIAYALSWVLFIIALFVVPRNRKPGEATAWLMLIFLLPFLGFILYLILGSPKLSRRRRAMQRTMSDTIKQAAATLKQRADLATLVSPPISDRYHPIVALNEHLGGMPAFTGNR